MSRPAAPLLALALLGFPACAPGACRPPLAIEICERDVLESSACRPPSRGLAAGIPYGLRASGAGLPAEGEVELRLVALGETPEREVGAHAAPAPAPGEAFVHPILFPDVGRYRLELGLPGGARLGAAEFEVEVATARRPGGAAEER